MSEMNPDLNGSDPSALGGNVLQIQCPTLGEFGLGRGQIGKESPLDMTEVKTQEMLQAFSRGEFHLETDETIPAICIDGRFMADGSRIPSPASAGGTAGIAYARDLANPGNELSDAEEPELVMKTVKELRDKGHKTTVHSDGHSEASTTGCGCGACAKVVGIYGKLSVNPDVVFDGAGALGFATSPEEQNTIVGNATKRLGSKNFSENRRTILDSAIKAGADYESLQGGHDEKIILWNTVAGTRIDTQAIFERYGVQAFVVDAWAFEAVGQELASTGYAEEANAIKNALAVYNVATADELCSEGMPVLPIDGSQFALAA